MKVFKGFLMAIALICLAGAIAGFGKWAAVAAVVASGISVGLTICDIIECRGKYRCGLDV